MMRMKMKILLVQADRDAGTFNTFTAAFFIPSIALEQVAACTPQGHEITTVNEWYGKVDTGIDCDIVGISAFTKDAFRAYAIADEFRARGIPVVLGGYHPTAMPQEAKQHADAVVMGEAEVAWPKLLEDVEKGRLKEFYGGKKVDGGTIPPARRDLNGYHSFFAAVQATRGCPYKCEFCQMTGFGDTLHRKRNVAEVVREIGRIPHRIFWFHDASLTINPRYTKILFREMIERGIRKKWIAFGNAAILSRDEEFLKLAKRAGCVAWMVGLESISQKALDEEVKKGGNTTEKIPKTIEKIEKEGMEVWASFIFGFDNDSPDVFDATFEKLNEWGIKVAEFNILTPFPKTPLFHRMLGENRIFSMDWSKYDLNHAVFIPRQMEVRELEEGIRKLYRTFFSISQIMRRVYAAPHVENKFFTLVANCAIKKFTGLNLQHWDGGMHNEGIAGYAIDKGKSHPV